MQTKVQKIKEYCIYFRFYELDDWGRRSSSCHRRFIQRFHLNIHGNCLLMTKVYTLSGRNFPLRWGKSLFKTVNVAEWTGTTLPIFLQNIINGIDVVAANVNQCKDDPIPGIR